MARTHQLSVGAGHPARRSATSVAVIASLALHLTWLGWDGRSTPELGGTTGLMPRPVPPAVAHVSLRLLPLPGTPVDIVDEPQRHAPPAHLESAAEQEAAPSGATGRAMPLPTSAETDSEPDWAGYLPRNALTRAPVATDAVLLPNPEAAGTGRWRGILTLFIDDAGLVRRVRAELGSELPPLLEDAARQAFMATRFTPAESNGRIVKARIQVEVEFVADEAPRPAGALGPAGRL